MLNPLLEQILQRHLQGPPPTRGDGTAPDDFPAYSRCTLADGTYGVKCNYRGCGHTGEIGHPSKMNCGPACPCPCCRMLQGETVYGLRVG
jgi:hypothetical protein